MEDTITELLNIRGRPIVAILIRLSRDVETRASWDIVSVEIYPTRVDAIIYAISQLFEPEVLEGLFHKLISDLL